MVSNKRRYRAKRHTTFQTQDTGERDFNTVREIQHALDQNPVDKAQLRKLAVVRGLVNDKLRSRVWPLLLGEADYFDPASYDLWKKGQHRDSTVVACDVERSLWSFTEGWTHDERDARRRELQAVLTAVICKHGGDVFYYQGLHDIASVLLFAAGERGAFKMLDCMVTCQLRDCTRPSLDAVLELLQLLLPLLSQCDTELYKHIEESGIPPFFALSWFITWFAHNVAELDQISRIFDALMASKPLMPLYLSSAVMMSWRQRLLKQDDASELHRTLTNLPILGAKSADALLIEALRLSKEYPPKKLLALSGLRMQSATCAEAELQNDQWTLPRKRPPKAGLIPRDAITWVNSQFGPASGNAKSLKNSTRSAAICIALLSTSALAVYLRSLQM